MYKKENYFHTLKYTYSEFDHLRWVASQGDLAPLIISSDTLLLMSNPSSSISVCSH